MEKPRTSKARRVFDKLAVESEPGLTNGQLMLTNFDLKPGTLRYQKPFLILALTNYPVELERRQWGAWNFVGFWIADSFNIVSGVLPRNSCPRPDTL